MGSIRHVPQTGVGPSVVPANSQPSTASENKHSLQSSAETDSETDSDDDLPDLLESASDEEDAEDSGEEESEEATEEEGSEEGSEEESAEDDEPPAKRCKYVDSAAQVVRGAKTDRHSNPFLLL